MRIIARLGERSVLERVARGRMRPGFDGHEYAKRQAGPVSNPGAGRCVCSRGAFGIPRAGSRRDMRRLLGSAAGVTAVALVLAGCAATGRPAALPVLSFRVVTR